VRVLAIGAHPDDIELGCGATLAAHRARGDSITMLVLTTGEQGPQASQSREQEQRAAAALLDAELVWGRFADGSVPDGRPAIDLIQSLIDTAGIDTIYGHSPNDTHQDHRRAGLASLAAARRSQQLLLYESPTSTRFEPSLHIDITGFLDAKLALVQAHRSQVLKNGLVDLEAVAAQARHRGFSARTHLAESFEIARYTIRLGSQLGPTALADAATDLRLRN